MQVEVSIDPGGVKAISRWLSEAIPPDRSILVFSTLKGC